MLVLLDLLLQLVHLLLHFELLLQAQLLRILGAGMGLGSLGEHAVWVLIRSLNYLRRSSVHDRGSLDEGVALSTLPVHLFHLLLRRGRARLERALGIDHHWLVHLEHAHLRLVELNEGVQVAFLEGLGSLFKGDS